MPYAIKPIIILKSFYSFTEGEVYFPVATDSNSNVYVYDDDGRYTILEGKECDETWRYATFEETMKDSFADVERFSQYQELARVTAIYPDQGELLGLLYVALGLAGEAGEIANKTKKIIRDTNREITPEYLEMVKKEMGDVLWYLSNMCSELNIDFKAIAQENLIKLYGRKMKDTLHGAGDNR